MDKALISLAINVGSMLFMVGATWMWVKTKIDRHEKMFEKNDERHEKTESSISDLSKKIQEHWEKDMQYRLDVQKENAESFKELNEKTNAISENILSLMQDVLKKSG